MNLPALKKCKKFDVDTTDSFLSYGRAVASKERKKREEKMNMSERNNKNTDNDF